MNACELVISVCQVWFSNEIFTLITGEILKHIGEAVKETTMEGQSAIVGDKPDEHKQQLATEQRRGENGETYNS